MLQYPGFDKIAFEIGPFGNFGPLKVHWYGIMYLVAFSAGNGYPDQCFHPTPTRTVAQRR